MQDFREMAHASRPHQAREVLTSATAGPARSERNGDRHRPLVKLMKTLLAPFTLDTRQPELLHAQLEAFAKQVPLLYFILIVNTVTFAATFYGKAPLSLTVLAPGGVVVMCLVRMAKWIMSGRASVSDRAAVRRLHGVVVLGAILGVLTLSWALALYDHGDVRARNHMVFYITITLLSSIFCLMHLRAAALTLMAVLVVPFAVFLLLTQGTTFVAIGVNLLLVAGAMTYILIVVSRDFEKLVGSQLETARLSDENYHLANVDSLTGLPNRR